MVIERGQTVRVQNVSDMEDHFNALVLHVDRSEITVRPDNGNLIMSFDPDTKLSIAGGYYIDES